MENSRLPTTFLGHYSAEALAEQKRVRELLAQSRERLKQGVRVLHSGAQICEAFLHRGIRCLQAQGSKLVKRAFARLITKSSAD